MKDKNIITDPGVLLVAVCQKVKLNLSPPGSTDKGKKGAGKYSLRELEKITGVSKSYLEKINKGENIKTIGIEIVIKLANALDIKYNLNNTD